MAEPGAPTAVDTFPGTQYRVPRPLVTALAQRAHTCWRLRGPDRHRATKIAPGLRSAGRRQKEKTG